MKIAYATQFDPFNSSTWSPRLIGHCGTNYYKAKALERQGTSVEYIGFLKESHSPLLKLMSKAKNRWHKHISKQVYHPWAEPFVNQGYAAQIEQKVSEINPEIVLCPDMNRLAYLECKQPIVIWTDASYAGLINFYSDYSNLCKETIKHLTTLDTLALEKCRLAIFSSEWAAKTVVDTYQIDSSKIKVIPSGGNVDCDRRLNDIKQIVEARSLNKCKLLFLGVDWYRKGGDIAWEVARELNRYGLNVELTIVGCRLTKDYPADDFVLDIGFISKATEEGLNKIKKLMAESHFLIMPSRAETYGNVFCEANSFGVPCISTNVGGIPTIIKDSLNGKVFPLNASTSDYCNYIYNLFLNYSEYKKLALSSFDEYQNRLNWTVASQSAKELFMSII